MPSFRARARTVDLLGRQQIAGIPTAISELFKNAHDAYAERVEADYFRDDEMLILRDDGVGMTPDDFVDRWLTLGTDSKVGSDRGLPLPAAPVRSSRPILGEKGIGRLAIASIGPQVLVLTRAVRRGKPSELTFALVNWRLFELPGINLDQLDIPVTTLADGRVPRQDDLGTLVAAVRAQVDELEVVGSEAELIAADLAHLDFDPGERLAALGEPALSGGGHGTQFIVVPTNSELAADIDRGEDKQAPPLVQTLIGFANTMLPDSPPPRIHTAFRDRARGEEPRDLIAPSEFFTPDDFATADHRVAGTFDEFGDFTGSVQVYGGEARADDFVWTGSGRKELRCGPFPFSLAYVQGDARDSRLQPTEHARVTRKLDRIGGIYIYRDDIRVLPYGTPSNDFLGVERRRTQNLGQAFFSYRRMFGVVELSTQVNRALQEKAGREGFISNGAYREFRELLSAFLVHLAAEFFSKRGASSDEFEEGRAAARERYRARRDRDARAEAARDRFAKRVAEADQALRDGDPQQLASVALDMVADSVQTAKGAPDAADRLLDAERGARKQIEDARSRFALSEPSGFGLSPDLRSRWDDLRPRLEALDGAVWEPALQTVAAEVQRAASAAGAGPNREQRLLASLERAATAASARVDRAADELNEAAADLSQLVGAQIVAARETMDSACASAMAAAAEAAAAGNGGDETADAQIAIEERLRQVATERENALRALAGRVEAAAGGQGDGAARDAAVLEEEVLSLRERTGRDLELAQIGMATEILTHELDLTIVGIRAALDRLGVRAEADARLSGTYNQLRTGFDHLDNYLALFTPLQRRLTRRRLLIKGSQIADFLRSLFARRLEADEIALDVTSAFEGWRGRGFRSTVYPVFVNLVDNASYWVTQRRPPRWIRLDADERGFIVSDSGPGVPTRDADAIYEFGFTRKPGGRGAGLHIARETLDRDGWSLELEEGPVGAAFRIVAPDDAAETP